MKLAAAESGFLLALAPGLPFANLTENNVRSRRRYTRPFQQTSDELRFLERPGGIARPSPCCA